MAMRLYILLIVIQMRSSSAQEQTLCAGRSGVLRFNPDEINGNVTGVVQFTKNGKPFMTFNTDTGDLTHFEHGRNISISNQYNIMFGSLQKSDEDKYIVSIPVKRGENNAVTVTATLYLTVKDPCFEKAEKKEDCYETECLTSKNGYLTFDGKNLTSMMINVCDSSKSGMYTCCSPTHACEQQNISDPKLKNEQQGNSTLTIALPIAIIAALVSVAVIIAVVFIMRKKRKQNDKGVHIPLST